MIPLCFTKRSLIMILKAAELHQRYKRKTASSYIPIVFFRNISLGQQANGRTDTAISKALRSDTAISKALRFHPV